jgi:hypothetical protein
MCPGGCGNLVKLHVTEDTCCACLYARKHSSKCRCGEHIKSGSTQCEKCIKYHKLWNKYGVPMDGYAIKLTVKYNYMIIEDVYIDFKKKYYLPLLDKTMDNTRLFAELYNVNIISSIDTEIFNIDTVTIKSFKFEKTMLNKKHIDTKHFVTSQYYLLEK